MIPKIVSEKNFEVTLKSELAHSLSRANPQKVALLVTCEYEGIFRNGGVGTYYRTLSEQLAEDGWYVFLLLFYVNGKFGGVSPFPAVQHIFSTVELESVLNLQPIHLSLLAELQTNPPDLESLRCLLLIQAIASCLKDSQIYIEFPEMMGVAHRTIQAKQANLLGANCTTAVTMHSGHEWVFEANERFDDDNPEYFWRVYHYEQYSFENADLVFFPSYFLKSKVELYGWRTSQAQHMPYFVPVLSKFHKTSLAAADSNQALGHQTDDLDPQSKNFESKPYEIVNTEEILSKLLGMTTPAERQYLESYAKSDYTGKGAIVDLGCWLGSLTVPLAMGLRQNSQIHPDTVLIHAYDLFRWEPWMDSFVEGTALEKKYQAGDSFLDAFMEQIQPWQSQIKVYPGDLTQMHWEQDHSIEFLMVDAMKSWELTNSILQQFFPALIPECSLVHHQDFVHYHTSWIHLIMYRLRDYFQPIQYIPYASFVFQQIKPIPESLLQHPYSFQDFSLSEIDAAFEYSLSLLPVEARYGVAAAKVMTFVHMQDLEQARKELDCLKERGLYSDQLEFPTVEQFLI